MICMSSSWPPLYISILKEVITWVLYILLMSTNLKLVAKLSVFVDFFFLWEGFITFLKVSLTLNILKPLEVPWLKRTLTQKIKENFFPLLKLGFKNFYSVSLYIEIFACYNQFFHLNTTTVSDYNKFNLFWSSFSNLLNDI